MLIKKEAAQTSESSQQIRHGIIGNGQSLSVGVRGDLEGTTEPASHAYRLEDTLNEYDIEKPDATTLRLVPLTEPFRKPGGGCYPLNIDGLTPHSSMANAITHLIKQQQDANEQTYHTVHSCVGKGGAPMSDIHKHKDKRKAGLDKNAYEASIYEAKALNRLLEGNGARLQYDAIVFTHGETDATLSNGHYGDELLKMQSDYATDLRKITGQKHEPVMIMSQQNTCQPTRQFMPGVTDMMWRIPINSGGRIICSGPKYQYHYPDGLHVDRAGYARIGEKYGQVYFETVIQGRPFAPLYPIGASYSAKRNEVTVSFHVPVAPLCWDETLPTPHSGTRYEQFWGKGRGFEVRDANDKRVVIEDVLIEHTQDSVTIQTAAQNEDGDVVHRPLKFAYAMTQEGEGFGSGFCGGTSDGRMGLLCDSDPGPGLSIQVKKCKVQKGSREVISQSGWVECSHYSIVEPGSYTITSFKDQIAYLERPWEGESGTVDLRVFHNQRNFSVAFSMEVDEER